MPLRAASSGLARASCWASAIAPRIAGSYVSSGSSGKEGGDWAAASTLVRSVSARGMDFLGTSLIIAKWCQDSRKRLSMSRVLPKKASDELGPDEPGHLARRFHLDPGGAQPGDQRAKPVRGLRLLAEHDAARHHAHLAGGDARGPEHGDPCRDTCAPQHRLERLTVAQPVLQSDGEPPSRPARGRGGGAVTPRRIGSGQRAQRDRDAANPRVARKAPSSSSDIDIACSGAEKRPDSTYRLRPYHIRG